MKLKRFERFFHFRLVFTKLHISRGKSFISMIVFQEMTLNETMFLKAITTVKEEAMQHEIFVRGLPSREGTVSRHFVRGLSHWKSLRISADDYESYQI